MHKENFPINNAYHDPRRKKSGRKRRTPRLQGTPNMCGVPTPSAALEHSYLFDETHIKKVYRGAS
jgi:hypothetical protein